MAAVPWLDTQPVTPTPSTSRRLACHPVLQDRDHRADADRLAHPRAIITRVWADVEAVHDRFAKLSRIGIDEISYKRGQKYLTVVVDHDSGRLV